MLNHPYYVDKVMWSSMSFSYRLTAGADNILLHYLCLEVGQGVWLGPTHHNSSLYGTTHHEMIKSFQTTCAAIRTILLGKAQVRECVSRTSNVIVVL